MCSPFLPSQNTLPLRWYPVHGKFNVRATFAAEDWPHWKEVGHNPLRVLEICRWFVDFSTLLTRLDHDMSYLVYITARFTCHIFRVPKSCWSATIGSLDLICSIPSSPISCHFFRAPLYPVPNFCAGKPTTGGHQDASGCDRPWPKPSWRGRDAREGLEPP